MRLRFARTLVGQIEEREGAVHLGFCGSTLERRLEIVLRGRASPAAQSKLASARRARSIAAGARPPSRTRRAQRRLRRARTGRRPAPNRRARRPDRSRSPAPSASSPARLVQPGHRVAQQNARGTLFGSASSARSARVFAPSNSPAMQQQLSRPGPARRRSTDRDRRPAHSRVGSLQVARLDVRLRQLVVRRPRAGAATCIRAPVLDDRLLELLRGDVASRLAMLRSRAICGSAQQPPRRARRHRGWTIEARSGHGRYVERRG